MNFNTNELRVLFQIAFRNLFSSFLNVIIGGIILVGTFFFVVGSSLLNNMDTAMSRSIIGSIGGHLQVYSDQSKDPITLFDNWQRPDLAVIPDFSKVKDGLAKIDNIKSVVPMGINTAFVAYGNTADLVLERLRKSIDAKIHGDHSTANLEKIDSLKSHVQQILKVIHDGMANIGTITNSGTVDPQSLRDLEKAESKDFWASFDRDPLNHLEFLENKIASLIPDADMVFLSYVGTDLGLFQRSFDRMEVVDGQTVPNGMRGLLISKYIYEHQFKVKTAFRLDQIHEALGVTGKTIAKDPDLQQLVKQNRTQTRDIVFQLDPISNAKLATKLKANLNSNENDLSKLLADFFTTTDANFNERYDFFYKEIAPAIELYRIRPGDFLTIKAFTKNGFVQALNLKVYGTFQFKGLEKSGLAGSTSLMDLVSFRDLYGYLSPDKLAEMNEIKKQAHVKTVDRDKVESELFGGDSIVGKANEKRINDDADLAEAKSKTRDSQNASSTITQNDIDHGIVLNAAVLLKNPALIQQTMKDILATSKQEQLGLKVSTWQQAAGNIGQFIYVAKAALYTAVFIIFVVALVIINNAVMMATLQRVREIGTMRAIGAQRSFVLQMVLTESVLLGIVFGSIGTILGALCVHWLGIKGIPAGNEFLYFFFSGPRLYPTLSVLSLFFSMFIIVLVTTISALYPAIIATRVSPVEAMQADE